MGPEKHFKSSWTLCVVIICVLWEGVPTWGYFDGEYLLFGSSGQKKTAPYFHAIMDAGGFSDGIYYGPSNEHPHPYHELLSGEWGAAIYYDNINTASIDPDCSDRKAMWLTQMFEYPDWYTGCDFEISGPCVNLHDPNDPALPNPGYSFIANHEVEIQIDYEVVDLEYRDPNFYLCRSPLGFLEPDEEDPGLLRSVYVYSDQYIFLQTYSITNLADETLTNLAFYQLLHSHGADEYDAYVNSTYLPMEYEDPLESYMPYNPVHCGVDSNTVGNFRFDITQWNEENYHDHKDWVGFSCAVEPDWIDTDVYRGGHQSGLFKPREGTPIHIENRALNGQDHLYLDEVAGAMGWNLGSLDPNETARQTVAFMFCYGGKTPVRHGLYIIKSDDAGDCFDGTDPNATIAYTIAYGNAVPNAVTETDVVLVDCLPAETDRMSVQVGGDGSYDLFTNTVTWTIGTLNINDSGQKTVTIRINRAKGGSELVNKAVLKNDLDLAQYTLRTPVCPVDVGEIVYVDKFAPGLQDGSSWQDAFHDLQDAIAYINSGYDVEEIWIANGTYKPGPYDEDSFVIPDGVEVYGGFAGYSNPTETKEVRQWRKNRTILSGLILEIPDYGDGELVYRNNSVVTMGNNSLLDGVTVEEGYWQGIDGSNVTSTVINCMVKENEQRGIYCLNGDMTIQWCEIKSNGQQGIYHEGYSKLLTIENSKIHDNQRDGILTVSSASTILNSLIYQNGSTGDYYGIHLGNPGANTMIRNNTIVHNINEGIRFVGSNAPDIVNCIVYYNNDNEEQLAGLVPDSAASHCCIADCNEVNGNINDAPGFVYDYEPYGFYHIKYESPCRNGGDSGSYTTETDMDEEDRVQESMVDIGADEVSCEDTFDPNDWNYDGVINYGDFAIFSAAWLSCEPNFPGDPNNWNPVCNLEKTGDSAHKIDLADFIAFCDPNHWLWEACWRDNYIEMYGMMEGSGESMMMAMPMMESLKAISGQMVYTEEKSIEQQILDLEEAIEFLEEIWMEDPYIQQEIDEEDWKEFMDAVYNSLYELKT